MRSTVKEFIEALMKGKIQAFPDQHDGQRKGYYERDLGIRYGKINDLKVPRDGDNEFQTATFDGYRRNAWIDYLVVSMYGKGISTMKMAEILEVHAKSESLIPDPVLNGCPLPDEKVPVSGEIPRSSYIHTWKIGFGNIS